MWERGVPDSRKFRLRFAERALEIHSATSISEARERSSLEFYTSRKKKVPEMEPYIAYPQNDRRLTAILRLNLKYALPWVPINSFCKMCNEWIADEDCWNHFIYECSGLPPVREDTEKIPYPFCIERILSGQAPDLRCRLNFAPVGRVLLEAER